MKSTLSLGGRRRKTVHGEIYMRTAALVEKRTFPFAVSLSHILMKAWLYLSDEFLSGMSCFQKGSEREEGVGKKFTSLHSLAVLFFMLCVLFKAYTAFFVHKSVYSKIQ